VDLIVQDFNTKTERYQVPKVYTRPSMPWVHVHALGAARRYCMYVFWVAGIATHSLVCGGAIEVAHTPRGAWSLGYEGPFNIIWVILVVVDRCKARMQCSGLT